MHETKRTAGTFRRAAASTTLVGLGLLLAAVPCAAQGVEPLRPDTVLSPAGMPRLVRLPAPGAPVVALRLSVAVREGPSEAGAARLLQMMALDRTRSLAMPVGAQVEGRRTPWGIAYTIVGSAVDAEYLGYLLRQVVAAPSEDAATVDRFRNSLMEEVRRLDETPRGRIVARLRQEMTPATPPLEGTVGTLPGIDRAGLRRLWARTHQPDRMTLIVAGDVPIEVLLASLQGLGAEADADAETPKAPAPQADRNRVQVLRDWYAEARTVVDGRDPRTAVAALLLADHLRMQGGGFESEVQLWETNGQRVLALIGAAYPRNASAMRQAIRSALGTVAGSLEEDAVRRAVASVRKEILLDARTPWGRASFVGRHLDATGDPAAGHQYLQDLEDIGLGNLRTFMRSLSGRTAVRVEVRP